MKTTRRVSAATPQPLKRMLILPRSATTSHFLYVCSCQCSNMLLEALPALARAKHPTGTCYASFSKMCCQYTSPLPGATHPSPALALRRRTRGNMTNAADNVHVAAGGLAVVSITVRKCLPGWISLGHGCQSSAQMLVPLLPQENDMVFFPLFLSLTT